MVHLNKAKVMIVEDDDDVRDIISMYLRKEGSSVVMAENGQQGLDLFYSQSPDLVVLDVMLPDMTGMDVCRKLRESSSTPILFVSYRKDAEYILNGLEIGGDDYVTKPFNPNILITRIKVLLRRVEQSERKRHLRLPHLTIDFDGCVVRVADKVVTLSAKEMQLLFHLAGNPNRVYSVADLYSQVWGWDKEGNEWTVIVHIRNLRKKIETDPAHPQYIRTVRGFGYKFVIE